MKKKILALLTTLFASAAVFAQLSISINASPPSCAQPCSGSLTVVATGGYGNITYLWNNSLTAETIDELCPGTYSVTAYDMECYAQEGMHCSDVASYTIPSTSENISCSVVSVPNGNIALTGGNADVLYLGYGPQSTNLNVNVTGTGPFTYSWTPAAGLSCTDCASPVFTPTAQGLYSFGVTVTNGSCTTQCSISICVLDIRVPGSNGNNKKVYVCHLPPGNPANVQNICISVNAVPAHVPLHGGDRLGNCNQVCNSGPGKTDETTPELLFDANETGLDVLLYPNPFTSSFHINIESSVAGAYEMQLFDITGKLLDERKNVDAAQELILGENLCRGIYFAQIRQGDLLRTIRLEKAE